ncbi:MAG TPA: hypothetical protein VN846_05865 [Candidatus Cybelea sp.]|jgi:hypothetical protein|nr:hypothetical protein [Candidatus Cybelea sp.]
MMLAIAALFFQFAPAIAAPTDVDPGSMVPAAKSAPAPIAGEVRPDQAKLSTTSASAQDDPDRAVAGTLTVASLETAARNSQELSSIRLPDSPSAKPDQVISATQYPRRNWLLLSIAQHSAAAFDAYSTRQAIGTGAIEADPFLRPFSHSPGLYAAIQVGPVILDYAARRMQRSNNSFIRRSWWVPQTASTGMYLFSGIHNMSLSNRH